MIVPFGKIILSPATMSATVVTLKLSYTCDFAVSIPSIVLTAITVPAGMCSLLTSAFKGAAVTDNPLITANVHKI